MIKEKTTDQLIDYTLNILAWRGVETFKGLFDKVEGGRMFDPNRMPAIPDAGLWSPPYFISEPIYQMIAIESGVLTP